MENNFSWTRFWCDRSGTISLADRGYLYDPESKYGNIFNKDVVPFETISEVPCLILLGEPGIGKTEALNNIEVSEENHPLRIDLRSYGDENRIIKKIFENDLFKACLEGKHNLHLFLDSLDECLLRIEHLAGLLVDEFEMHKNNPNLKNISLRIACRTADWPSLLEQGLSKLWGSENIRIMELAPLRRIDVHYAANNMGINADQFMKEVRDKEVIPFAIKPITLMVLLKQYLKNGELPSTQQELYLRGCTLLCEETNLSRRSAGHTRSRSVPERLKTASRIAAMTIFSNKNAVWQDFDSGNIPEENITKRDISGADLEQKETSLRLSDFEIDEVLSTGLFSSRGLHQLGWSHQTYAEYLAAVYVTENNLSLEQIMSLIEHPIRVHSEQKIVPQLHEVAAWIATMNKDVFRQITKFDPKVLLRSDVTKVNVEDKVVLVDSLLKLYHSEQSRDLDLKEYYYKLNHPNIEQQIKPYIIDRTCNFSVRRTAMTIAKACKLNTLWNDLMNIATDLSESYPIRIQATIVLVDLEGEESKRNLLPLARLDVGDDAGELKAVVLRGLWPNYLSSEELFSLLTIPNPTYFAGSYRRFWKYEIINKIPTKDLNIALEWVLTFAKNKKMDSQMKDFMYGLLNKAGHHLDRDDVATSFISVLCERLVYDDDFGKMRFLFHDEEIRRTILFSLVNTEVKQEILLSYVRKSILKSEDFSWMIEQLGKDVNPKVQTNWSILIKNTVNMYDIAHVNLLHAAIQNNEILTQYCQAWFQSIELDSQQAYRLKESYMELEKYKELEEPILPIDPPIEERISLDLDQFESGNLYAWSQLIYDLGVDEYTMRLKVNEFNIKAFPNWDKVDIDNENRIIRAAKDYVLQQQSNPEDWFGLNVWTRSSLAGYTALWLLYEQDKEFLLTLPASVWGNWSPVILTHWEETSHDEISIYDQLIKLAYSNAPQKVITDLIQLMQQENTKYSDVFSIDSVKKCWDNRLGEAILDVLQTHEWSPQSLKSILNELLQHQIDGVEDYASSLIRSAIILDDKAKDKARFAAISLLSHSPKIGWSILWPLKDTYTKFVTNVFVSFSEIGTAQELLLCLSESELADCYIWLATEFPPSEDINYDNEQIAHYVTSREYIANFRDLILRYLSNKGTLEGCNEVARIGIALPELTWLKWTLLDSQNVARRNSWSPPTPLQILYLVANSQHRLVQNEDQLLDVIMESLKRLELKLHGATPLVEFLWNENKSKVYWPKSENQLSDYIKNYLQDDLVGKGIVINREVEIKSSVGSSSGERTDIHVNATLSIDSAKDYKVITIIIEVKGNWHRELFKAMKTQLVDRYLQKDEFNHGLYLIGWFESLKWDNEDNRKKHIPSSGLECTKKRLEEQAISLSNERIQVRSFVMNLSL